MKKIICLSFLVLIYNGIFAQQRLTPETLWKLGRVSEIQLSPDAKQILYGTTYYDVTANKGTRNLFILPVAEGTPMQITDFKASKFNAIWRPDGKKIGFISTENGSAQVWEMNPDGTGRKQVSNITDGINGFYYAPTSNYILFIKDVKLDKTTLDIYPDLPLANARIIEDLFYRHWDNWDDYSYSHIFIAPYSDGFVGEAIDIMKNERFDAPLTPDGGMEQITWSPDGKSIAYTCRKLHGRQEAVSTNSDIYIYHLDTKQTENVSSGMMGYDRCPAFSPDGNYLAWQSMKTAGFEADKDRLILYNLKNKTQQDLTETFDQSVSDLQWSGDSKKIFFISGYQATYQIYSIDVASKKIKQITQGAHDYTSYKIIDKTLVATKMTISLPTEIFKVDIKTGKETQLSFTNKSILDKIELGKVEGRWITTTDNKKMLVWVIYPPFFDKTKKYPALLYCQGGPQSAVSQFFSYRWNFQMMAANDYIVVAPNRRGLPTFGQAWNDEISGDYGGQNMLDYLSAIDTLAKEPYVNADKLGAVGASYGAFSVYWLAGNHHKRFKAFIAHCGMFNFESWYGTTEEMWFANKDLGGAYWQNPKPKSYEFSPHNFVGNWDTPILVIHGGNDFRIPYTQGMEAFNAAQLQGIPSKFLFFPEETHFVLKPQNAILWQREFFKWFDQWLKIK